MALAISREIGEKGSWRLKLIRPLRARWGALLSVLVGAATACTHLPEIENLSYLAPREGRGSLWYAANHAPRRQPASERPALTLNDVQLKGSHNSYHRAPRIALSRGWKYSHAPLETQLEEERQNISRCAGSRDFREGIRAFLDKRPARFEGR